ncbi:PIN domain-like protein [Eremomyces bilateralis CBS 781.70]|uniref:PIN domain-like protein n=1 Tax=Eremomyces bilateralis CBS 781.70 TaxID=1392243 RepID=A0A6G1FXG1_9PEZI|nr:PIN domain-like protein [Eremomyces bilateralis CBS 781.70]KAF1810356.1 PIN domain-like protein [Eremomyces bilateralis CBS 781.70]
MGVTGLWTVVQPCARPIKIETLNRKRLAVDASIWIYQFLKAVRDKEGNALRNSHVVGFFRRICKLLFIGIKPIFVFDGGAPALKRQTINARKRRREGRRDDAVRTAGKLLAVQMQRLGEEEERRRKEESAAGRHEDNEEEAPLPENLVYAEETLMTPQERTRNRTFKKKDAYHLPELDASLAEMGGPADLRIMSLEELEEYARQFNSGEDVNLYDFSKIDFDGSFFQSLPASDRYNILNAARLRSRLRMGYSKDQLDSMFPDRMAFSKFQIERVRERNELTQRLMNLNGMNDDAMWGVHGGGRVAGEKGREYVLVKNEGVEGGWALGVVTNRDEGNRDKPINVDELKKPKPDDEPSEEEGEEDEFEDVPVEGLNRLPKQLLRNNGASRTIVSDTQQHVVAPARRAESERRTGEKINPLFVADTSEKEEQWEDVEMDDVDQLFEEPHMTGYDSEEEQLQRAIAMSLGQEPGIDSDHIDDDDFAEVFQQSRVEEAKSFTGKSGTTIARMANERSRKGAAVSEPIPINVPKPRPEDSAEHSESEDDFDLQRAMRSSKAVQKDSNLPTMQTPPVKDTGASAGAAASHLKKPSSFDGPLPFERLDLGSSILGKKKKTAAAPDENAGGFEKEHEIQSTARPVPPWFERTHKDTLQQEKTFDKQDRDKAKQDGRFQFETPARIRRHDANDIIDIDDPSQEPPMSMILGQDASTQRPTTLPELPQKPDESLSTQQPFKPRSEQPPESPELEQYEWEESPPPEIVQPSSTQDDLSGVEAMRAKNAVDPTDEDLQAVEDDQNVIATQEHVPQVPLDDAMPIPPENEDYDEYFSDPEEAELFRQLETEADEHARFASTLNNKSKEQHAIDFDQELKQLRDQQKKDRRDADEVTQTMVQECQQLLTLFGLPFITAPMEAEAQCAELVSLGLVDGIVTDDSDTFLFGGTRVYKNMFNQAKYVECYLSQDLESEFALDREKLIAIAQLLGSDYTEGLPGVGPVSALEIISEFDCLENFKEWWLAVQNGSRPKSEDTKNPFRRKFRKNSTKLFLPVNFPDPRVEDAYLHPEVDSDPSTFVWGVPDLDRLRSFLMATVGWSPERTDEVLVPVIRDMNRRELEGTQSNITNFFGGSVGAGAFAPRRKLETKSKRMENALGRIATKAKRGKDNATEGLDQDPTGEDSPGQSRGQTRSRARKKRKM